MARRTASASITVTSFAPGLRLFTAPPAAKKSPLGFEEACVPRKRNLHLTFLVSQDQLKGSLGLNRALRARCQRESRASPSVSSELRDEAIRRSAMRDPPRRASFRIDDEE